MLLYNPRAVGTRCIYIPHYVLLTRRFRSHVLTSNHGTGNAACQQITALVTLRDIVIKTFTLASLILVASIFTAKYFKKKKDEKKEPP
jgi:hypothetical protein